MPRLGTHGGAALESHFDLTRSERGKRERDRRGVGDTGGASGVGPKLNRTRDKLLWPDVYLCICLNFKICETN